MCCWCQLSAKSESLYATDSGAVGCRFTYIMVAEWRGVVGRSFNSTLPVVFSHIFLMKTLGVCRSKEIQARITIWTDHWEKGLHTGLVGDAETEGADREGRASSGGYEEYEAVAQIYHDNVLSSKLRQAGGNR